MNKQKTVKLAFISAEPETGSPPNLPPVIFHHGMLDSKERWLPIIQKLANDTQRKVFAIDARNHGESERSDEFTFSILAEDLEQFMISQGIKKATIVGHSMGGWVTMMMALKKPERVEKIVIEDFPPEEMSPEFTCSIGEILRKHLEFFKQFSADDSEEYVHEKLTDFMLKTYPPEMLPPRDLEFIKQWKYPIRKTDTGYESKANLAVIAAAWENPEKTKLNFSGVFHGDTLFLCGGKSFLKVYEKKDRALQLFPKAQFKVFEDVGHEIFGVCPDEVYSQILSFLRN